MNNSKEPLAYRMCPRNLDEYVGQEHILSQGKLLYRMIKADRLSSVIFFGPPGTGKTSLARLIAKVTNMPFSKLNAVSAGVGDIKQIVSDTQNSLLNPQGRTLLFIDEIHRFNKLQQDALLPYVEDGTIVLIGATTENPFFEVNKAIISRSTVFQLHPLSEENIKKVIYNALSDCERGYGNLSISITDDAVDFLANSSAGDARVALNAIELAVLTSRSVDGRISINRNVIEDCVQKKAYRFDKKGESHYDIISAFIKSMRGSNPDGAIYYLARMLEGGEDINFIARRIVICAAEDVGTANPNALVVAQAACEAVRMIGMPEARIILAEACIVVATSPKSNASYMAINTAIDHIQNSYTGEVPMHLRNAETGGMKDLGYGNGYKYAHDYPGNVVLQQYLPDAIKNTVYYKPYGNGYERNIIDYINWKNKKEDDNK